jgi:hypothetical protein
LPHWKSDGYRYVFETVVSGCLEESLVDGLGFTVEVSRMEADAALHSQFASKSCSRIASDGPLRRDD